MRQHAAPNASRYRRSSCKLSLFILHTISVCTAQFRLTTKVSAVNRSHTARLMKFFRRKLNSVYEKKFCTSLTRRILRYVRTATKNSLRVFYRIPAPGTYRAFSKEKTLVVLLICFALIFNIFQYSSCTTTLSVYPL